MWNLRGKSLVRRRGDIVRAAHEQHTAYQIRRANSLRSLTLCVGNWIRENSAYIGIITIKYSCILLYVELQKEIQR